MVSCPLCSGSGWGGRLRLSREGIVFFLIVFIIIIIIIIIIVIFVVVVVIRRIWGLSKNGYNLFSFCYECTVLTGAAPI